MHNPRLTSFTVYRLFLLIALVVATFMGNSVSAQVTTSSILGSITDSSGAAIQNAAISVRDVDRNLTKTASSNEVGFYRVDFLVAGNYTVSVSAAGFKTTVQNGINLSAGVPATIDLKLSPGAVSESIQVTSAAPMIETSNAEIGTTIDPKDFTELPLINRNPYTLLDLTPGVQENVVKSSFGAPTLFLVIAGGVFNGSGSTNVFFDGAPNLNGLNGGGAILPNPDSLQEFRIQTFNYGAAAGRFPNGIVNTVVRTGTNSIHGALFEYLRNPNLNAQPWGALATSPKEPLHRNQFGATLGGPILKSKAFFFGSYDGIRQTDATLYAGARVPTALERTGNFTQSIGTLPTDPTTSKNFVCNGVVNVICSNRQDATALALMNKYVPVGNTTITTSSGVVPAWTGYYPSPLNQDDFLIKGNFVASKAHTISATYFMSVGNASSLATVGGSGQIPNATQTSTWRQQNSVVNDVWIISPNTVNNFWAAYTRMRNNRVDTPQLSLADYGSTFEIQGTPALPNLTVTGYWHMVDQNGGPAATDDYAFRDMATWTHGKHTMQYGGEFYIDKASKAALLNNYGQITMSGVVTKNALADYLIGTASSFEQDAPNLTQTAAFTYSGFFQDDFRMTPRLMVNLGLRYDVQTPPVEPKNNNATFVAGQQSTRFPNAPKGMVFPGDAGIPRGITPVRFKHISPRIGFAFDPFGNQKTSIRGGVGVFWGTVSEETWDQGANGAPFAIGYSFPNTSSITGSTLSNPYQGNVNPFPYTGGVYPWGIGMGGIAKNADWPETVQTNFSIQQQITGDLGVTVAFVGGYGWNQILGVDNNYPTASTNYAASLGQALCGTSATIVPTTKNYTCRRPVQPAGGLTIEEPIFQSDYNGLQVTVTKRLAHHVNASGYYTWSKSLTGGTLQGGTPGGSIQDVNNLRAERSRAANDIAQQAVMSLIYQSQYSFQNKITRSIVNGWELAPIVRLHTGTPFGIANGVDANLDGASTDRAELVPGQPFNGPHKVSQWFNTAAFSQNAAVSGSPVDGNSSPDIINTPGFAGIDLTLARTFAIREHMNFQFRAEAGNAFNIVSYGSPGATVATSTFGVITSANSTPRQIQLGGKINF